MNDKEITLDKLKIGELSKISHIDIDSKKMYNRLLDLGFVKGSTIRALFKCAIGNTVAYLIKGTVVGLRSTDTKRIYVDIV